MSLFLIGLFSGLCLPYLFKLLFQYNTSHRRREVYEQDDVLLNLEPVSAWHNMGLWSLDDEIKSGTGSSFAKASERLALHLARLVQLSSGQSIMDVGFGNGESLKLWRDRFAPCRIYGLTSLKHQLEHAQKLVGNDDHVSISLGDAARDLSRFEPHSIDCLFAIDCAYHFDTRAQFLACAHRVLKKGASLAMTDLCLPSRALSLFEQAIVRAIAFGARIPRANLMTVNEYEAMLRGKGFERVDVRDISSDVFGGLAGYIRARDERLGHVLDSGQWRRMTMFARVLRWLDGNGDPDKRRLVFVTVTASTANGLN